MLEKLWLYITDYVSVGPRSTVYPGGGGVGVGCDWPASGIGSRVTRNLKPVPLLNGQIHIRGCVLYSFFVFYRA